MDDVMIDVWVVQEKDFDDDNCPGDAVRICYTKEEANQACLDELGYRIPTIWWNRLKVNFTELARQRIRGEVA